MQEQNDKFELYNKPLKRTEHLLELQNSMTYEKLQ